MKNDGAIYFNDGFICNILVLFQGGDWGYVFQNVFEVTTSANIQDDKKNS